MIFLPDFDVDDALRTLDAASKMYPADSKEEATVQLAAISLLYVLHSGKMKEFRKYYLEFADPDYQVTVSHVFATREEADAWLASGQASDRTLVSIAGQGFQVIQLPNKPLRFLRTPLPEELGPPRGT